MVRRAGLPRTEKVRRLPPLHARLPHLLDLYDGGQLPHLLDFYDVDQLVAFWHRRDVKRMRSEDEKRPSDATRGQVGVRGTATLRAPHQAPPRERCSLCTVQKSRESQREVQLTDCAEMPRLDWESNHSLVTFSECLALHDKARMYSTMSPSPRQLFPNRLVQRPGARWHKHGGLLRRHAQAEARRARQSSTRFPQISDTCPPLDACDCA